MIFQIFRWALAFRPLDAMIGGPKPSRASRSSSRWAPCCPAERRGGTLERTRKNPDLRLHEAGRFSRSEGGEGKPADSSHLSRWYHRSVHRYDNRGGGLARRAQMGRCRRRPGGWIPRRVLDGLPTSWSRDPMEFRKVLALRGPNLWANFPVLEAWVDLGLATRIFLRRTARLQRPADGLAADDDRAPLQRRQPRRLLRAAPPRHLPGPHPRARDAWSCRTWPAPTVGFGRARETSEEGVYKVVIEYEEEAFGRACLRGRPRAVPGRASTTGPFDVDGRGREAPRPAPRGPPRARAPARSSRRPRSGASRPGGSTPGAWCSSARAPASGASSRPRPTAPAPSPRRSPRTRS